MGQPSRYLTDRIQPVSAYQELFSHTPSLHRRLVGRDVSHMIADCRKMWGRRRSQSHDCGLWQNARKEGGGRKERERRNGDLSRRWQAKLDAPWLITFVRENPEFPSKVEYLCQGIYKQGCHKVPSSPIMYSIYINDKPQTCGVKVSPHYAVPYNILPLHLYSVQIFSSRHPQPMFSLDVRPSFSHMKYEAKGCRVNGNKHCPNSVSL
jgi:hypothetical protein